MQNLFPFFFGVLFSSLLTWGALKVFPHIKLLDFPERYGLKRKKLPYPGGLIFLFLVFFFLIYFELFYWLLLPLVVLGTVSFWDDRKPLPAVFRILIHLGIAFFVYWMGVRIDFIGNPFGSGESIDLTQWSFLPFILTLLWIVVVQNALNWFDGIKGLAVGVSGVGFMTLGFFGLIRQEVLWEQGLSDSLLLSFYLAGLCIGAFLFFWREKIILGDTGSQILGFLLAVLSIFAGTKIVVTLLVLCLPLLDFLMVVFRRLFIDKKSPFSSDLKHIHHNISRRIGEPNTALLLICLSALFGGIALFLSGIEKIWTFVLVAIFVVGVNVWSMRKNH